MLLRVVLVLAVLYASVTGYAGWRVGSAIAQAKHGSLLVRIGSHLLGRDTTERLALRQAHLPDLITDSPIFWATLRITE